MTCSQGLAALSRSLPLALAVALAGCCYPAECCSGWSGLRLSADALSTVELEGASSARLEIEVVQHDSRGSVQVQAVELEATADGWRVPAELLINFSGCSVETTATFRLTVDERPIYEPVAVDFQGSSFSFLAAELWGGWIVTLEADSFWIT